MSALQVSHGKMTQFNRTAAKIFPSHACQANGQQYRVIGIHLDRIALQHKIVVIPDTRLAEVRIIQSKAGVSKGFYNGSKVMIDHR